MEVGTRLIPLWSAKQPLIGGLLLMMWCMYLCVYVLEVVSLIFSNWQRFSYFRSVWRQLATKRPLHINLKWFVKNAFLQSIPSSVAFQKEERRRRGRKGNLTMMTASWEKIDWMVPKKSGKITPFKDNNSSSTTHRISQNRVDFQGSPAAPVGRSTGR